MFKLHAKYAQASESGDYFQVLFEEGEELADGRYFLIQRQFEFPDACECAIETEILEMCGHFRVQRAVLGRDCLRISWIGRGENEAEISFATDDESYAEICRIMGIMIPELVIRPPKE